MITISEIFQRILDGASQQEIVDEAIHPAITGSFLVGYHARTEQIYEHLLAHMTPDQIWQLIIAGRVTEREFGNLPVEALQLPIRQAQPGWWRLIMKDVPWDTALIWRTWTSDACLQWRAIGIDTPDAVRRFLATGLSPEDAVRETYWGDTIASLFNQGVSPDLLHTALWSPGEFYLRHAIRGHQLRIYVPDGHESTWIAWILVDTEHGDFPVDAGRANNFEDALENGDQETMSVRISWFNGREQTMAATQIKVPDQDPES